MINKVFILGRLGKNPELKSTDKTTIATFSVATSEKYADKEVTQWHNCKAFGPVANNLAKFFHKGDMIFIEGKIVYNAYEKDGKKMTFTDIVVLTWSFCGDKGKDEKANDAF